MNLPLENEGGKNSERRQDFPGTVEQAQKKDIDLNQPVEFLNIMRRDLAMWEKYLKNLEQRRDVLSKDSIHLLALMKEENSFNDKLRSAEMEVLLKSHRLYEIRFNSLLALREKLLDIIENYEIQLNADEQVVLDYFQEKRRDLMANLYRILPVDMKKFVGLTVFDMEQKQKDLLAEIAELRWKISELEIDLEESAENFEVVVAADQEERIKELEALVATLTAQITDLTDQGVHAKLRKELDEAISRAHFSEIQLRKKSVELERLRRERDEALHESAFSLTQMNLFKELQKSAFKLEAENTELLEENRKLRAGMEVGLPHEASEKIIKSLKETVEHTLATQTEDMLRRIAHILGVDVEVLSDVDSLVRGGVFSESEDLDSFLAVKTEKTEEQVSEAESHESGEFDVPDADTLLELLDEVDRD